MKIVLGSSSPRRKEILSDMGYTFTIKTSNSDEKSEEKDPKKYVVDIATKKLEGIDIEHDELLICADTIVVHNNKILGKPKSKEDAYNMISSLQGNTHHVYTASVIKYKGKIEKFLDESVVSVNKMTDDEIEEYINTDEPYDKAGGYAIQGIFNKYIDSYTGDYYNIMGFPLHLKNEIERIGK